jgi:hypothetical protein
MIKDEIKYAESNLSQLKCKYKELVIDIKKVFYEKVDYWDDNSPRKPKNDKQKFQAALSLVEGRCPRISYDLNISQAKSWKNESYVWFDYWTIHQERFDCGNGILATTIIRKKNIKLLKDICKDLWIKEVSASYWPNTVFGLDEWIEKTDVDKIYELMCKHLNEHKKTRVNMVTDRSLYLKDIVIIYPENRGINHNYFL